MSSQRKAAPNTDYHAPLSGMARGQRCGFWKASEDPILGTIVRPAGGYTDIGWCAKSLDGGGFMVNGDRPLVHEDPRGEMTSQGVDIPDILNYWPTVSPPCEPPFSKEAVVVDHAQWYIYDHQFPVRCCQSYDVLYNGYESNVGVAKASEGLYADCLTWHAPMRVASVVDGDSLEGSFEMVQK